MASSYTTRLRLEKQAYNENDASWGTRANTVFDLLDDSIGGMATISTTGGTTVLTANNSSSDQARNAIIKATGVLVSNATFEIPAQTKIYTVWNATTGAYTLTIKTNAGTGVAVTQAKKAVIFCDGTDCFTSFDDQTLMSMTAGNNACDFRLSLTTATPVTTSDVTAATTMYCVPYNGNYIDLYDGSSTWNRRSSAEFSLALGTLTSSLPYDVFCYDNAGTPTLEFLAWTNDTARATSLVYQNGVLVKSGDTTRRYLGTFYTTATTTTEDSAANRYLWNFYHRVTRKLKSATATTDSWLYSTATWRQANATASNQVNFVIGRQEDPVRCDCLGMYSDAGAYSDGAVGIGLDSTTTSSAQLMASGKSLGSTGTGSTGRIYQHAVFDDFAGAGKHYLAWLEYASGATTGTFYGDSGVPTFVQAGLIGHLLG